MSKDLLNQSNDGFFNNVMIKSIAENFRVSIQCRKRGK